MRGEGHRQAAAAFKAIFNVELWTYKVLPVDNHSGLGQARFFLHSGLASWNDALGAVFAAPDTAADHMSKALNHFRQCGDEQLLRRSETWLKNARVQRTCWMCHREFQGDTMHFNSFSASITPYAASVVTRLGQDTASIDVSGQTLVLCRPCHSVVENLANRLALERANEVRQEVQQLIDQLSSALTALNNRLQQVERIAHRH